MVTATQAAGLAVTARKDLTAEKLKNALPYGAGPAAAMSSLPTFTAGVANAGPTITNSSLFTNTSGSFTFPDSRTGAFTNTFNVVDTARPTVGATSGGTFWSVEFVTDATTIEIYLQSASSAGIYRLMVDGQWASSDYKSIASGGGSYRDKYAFGSRSGYGRRCKIVMNPYCRFGGVYVDGDADRVWPTRLVGPVFVCMGDSEMEGTYANPFRDPAHTLGRALGINRTIESGVGATGFVATAGGTKVAYPTRLATDVIAWNPDIVYIPPSINDSGLDISSAAASIFSQVRAACPNALIVTSGPICFHGSNAAYRTLRDTAFAALNAVGGRTLTIDNVDSSTPWTFGTGSVASPAAHGSGAGNANYYADADGAHANPGGDGYEYYASRLAEPIAQAIRAL